MWEKVAEQVQACGGELRMRQKIVGVQWKTENGKQNEVTSVTVENIDTGAKETVPCDYFFSTMPVKHLVAGLDPKPPLHVIDVANGLIYRDFLTVGLLLKKLHVQVRGQEPAKDVPDNWIYVQDGNVKVGRIQIFNNWSPYMVADRKNSVWIGLEYFVNEGDELWSMDDAKLIELGKTEMETIQFVRKEDVLDACVLRMPKAYPAYFGTYDRLNDIRDWTLTIPNLFLIGRNGMHRYNNQDHSMLTAMTAIDNIVAGSSDNSNLWEVNADRVYHEEKELGQND